MTSLLHRQLWVKLISEANFLAPSSMLFEKCYSVFVIRFFHQVHKFMVGHEKVMLSWFTKNIFETLSHSDDVLGEEHTAWPPVAVGSGPHSVMHSLCDTGHDTEPFGPSD